MAAVPRRDASAGLRRELEAAAKTIGAALSFIVVNGPNDFDEALARAKRSGVNALVVTSDPVTLIHRGRVVRAALKYGLPGIYWTREYVEEGGLMT